MGGGECKCDNNCNVVSQCRSCGECGGAWGPSRCAAVQQLRLDQRQQVIQKVVRVDSSQYAMNRAAATVFQARPAEPTWKGLYNNPSTMSDRKVPHVTTASQTVYRHTSSSHGSKTRGWPGMTSAGGVGVDVKHGSYARYLARKKGAVLRAGAGAYKNREKRRPSYNQIVENPSLTRGGKNVKFSIVASKDCQCGLAET
jgi:hypothetical protein